MIKQREKVERKRSKKVKSEEVERKQSTKKIRENGVRNQIQKIVRKWREKVKGSRVRNWSRNFFVFVSKNDHLCFSQIESVSIK